MIYCESKDMVEKIKNDGIDNVQRKNNFRDVIKRPKVKSVKSIFVNFAFKKS